MATTTNYSWTTPDDTALVKDGAAAIRSLGSAIDSTVFTNASAAINKTIVDAKGDIIAATAADTVARVAVGTDGQILTADAASAAGVKWAALPAGGGMTLISTVTASGATGASFTSIPSTYKHLLLIWDGCKTNTNATHFYVRANNDSSALYVWRGRYVSAGYANDWYTSDTGWWFSGNQNESPIGANTSATAGYYFSGNMWIYNYTETTTGKTMEMTSTGQNTDTGQNTFSHFAGSYLGTSAISRLDILRSGSQTLTGTIRLYGVS